MWCRPFAASQLPFGITSFWVGVGNPLRRTAGEHRSPELSRSQAKSLIRQVAELITDALNMRVSTEGFEVSLMSKLDHPNVVRLFETFVEAHSL